MTVSEHDSQCDIRIILTSGGKIKTWVANSLALLGAQSRKIAFWLQACVLGRQWTERDLAYST
jgi:hypothetical protein